ncbi:TetR family transcriptional regulator [Kribbella solani]|uniref:AcrR family transcriptional regulator n=1 Tax=Kribbella solani TaxID=236067 RepID=A0A841DFN2_9ACTN|nr:AcrR family transcriptional regulator [Kribbella solani]
MTPKPAPANHRQVSPSPRGERRREQIVTAALALFASSGYRGTGMTEVAAQVGITEPGVLYHFGTKVGLLRAVVEQRATISRAFARDAAELGGLAGIRELIPLAERSIGEPDLIKLFSVLLAENFEADGPAHDFFVEHYRALRVSVVELIEAGQRRGEVRAGIDPALKAVEILGALDGMASQWLLDPEAIDFVACIEAYVATLERDLAATS